MRVAAIAALGAVLLLAALSPADEESALFFHQRGLKALGSKDLAGAERFFKKALDEQKNFVPSLLGLARTASVRNNKSDALDFLESCLNQKLLRKLTPVEEESVQPAIDLFRKLDRARLEYRLWIDAYVRDLMILARKHRKRKPELAVRCLKRVLKLRPDHTAARKELADQGGGASESEGDAKKEKRGIPLWNGKDLSEWEGGPPTWQVKDGLLVGENEGAMVFRTVDEFEGDFAVEVELRVIKTLGKHPLVSVQAGLVGLYEAYTFEIWSDKWMFRQSTGENRATSFGEVPFRKWKGGFDPMKWHTYRLEFKKRRGTCYVDGKKILDRKLPRNAFDGFVAIWLQDRQIEIRRITQFK